MKEPKAGDAIYLGIHSNDEIIFDYFGEGKMIYAHVKMSDGREFAAEKLGTILAMSPYYKPTPEFTKNSERYFYKTDSNENIKSIYRLVENEGLERISELIWLNGQWEASNNLIHMLITGEMYLEEVNLEIVKKFTPEIDTSVWNFD